MIGFLLDAGGHPPPTGALPILGGRQVDQDPEGAWVGVGVASGLTNRAEEQGGGQSEGPRARLRVDTATAEVWPYPAWEIWDGGSVAAMRPGLKF